MLMGVGHAVADDVTVSDVTIPQGGQAVVNISLSNPNYVYTAGQMVLSLPDGVSAVLNASGNPTIEKGERFASTEHGIGSSHKLDGTEQFSIFSISSEAIPGTDGILFGVLITADESLAVGTVLEGTLVEIEMTTTDAVRTLFNDKTFKITIGEPADTRIVLDETSTTMLDIEPATNADVRVKRTIKANEWSTLVLPFAVTEAQLEEAFGEGVDVELADFTSWSSEEDADENIVGINVGFTTITEVEANHPCIIKTNADITEFTLDGVDIEELEEEPTVQVGKKKAERGYLIGTYVAGTTVPEYDVFLNGNQFWYSMGLTKMKAMRAYFEFADVLTSVEGGSETKIRFHIEDNDATAIQSIAANAENNVIYSINGVRMGSADKLKALPKGLYIVNGKKVIIK
jgi:hypothetical protein